MSGVYETLEADPRNIPTRRAPADTRPPPGIFNFDGAGASAEQSFYDAPGRSYQLRSDEIAGAAAELARLNGKRPTDYYIMPPGEPIGGPTVVDEDSFWRDLAQVRRTRPDALKDLGSDRADYDKRLRQRFQAGAADRQARMAQGGLIGNLLGGAAGAFTDPINIMTLPIGGGGTSIARSIIVNSLTNAGIEVAEQPFLKLEREQQGGELSLGEAAMNVAGAGIGAAVLTGGGHAIGAAAEKIFSLEDRALASALRQSVKGDWELSPQQAAALHVLDRGGEIDATNPFAGTYTALDMHARQVDQVLAAMARQPEPRSLQSAPVATPQARSLDSNYAAIVGIEGGTNRDGSFRTSPAGAIGPAQVMPGTAPIAAKLAGLPWDPVKYRTDAQYNLALGRAYYDDMLRQFGGDPVKAAAAYNAGPGSASTGRGVRGAMARAEAAGRAGEWVDFLPPETRKYVANFQRRTGAVPGETVALPDAIDAPELRSPDLDAERPNVFAEPLTVREDVLQAGLVPVLRDLAASGGTSLNRLPELAAGLGVDDLQLRRALDRLVDDGDLTRTAGGVYRRRAGSGPEDMLRFITRQGGLSYDGLAEGSRMLGTKGHDLRNTGNLATMVPGGGPLLRPNGRSLDEMGELLWDSGYFGPPEVTPRPTDSELIGLLDDSIRKREKRFSSFDQAPAPREDIEAGARDLPEGFQSIDHYRAERDAYDAAAQDMLGRPLADDEFLEAHGIGGEQRLLPDDIDPEQRIADDIREMVNRQFDATREMTPAEFDQAEAEGLNGPPVVDLEVARAFDDPDGEGVAKVADSLWHDIEQAQVAREGDADAGELIDLDDGKGPRSIAEIQKELADDEADIATIESCLAPQGAMAGAGA
jgi:hypothetical protein